MSAGSAGSALAFVDTNIWLYAFSDSQDKLKTQLRVDKIQPILKAGIGSMLTVRLSDHS
jgi:predicted nucleic acid-binding protein